MTHTWLISSGGRRGALVKILRGTPRGTVSRVVVADASPAMSAAGRLSDQAELAPKVRDPEFIPEMLRLCKKHDVARVVPTIDPELSVYARHRADFSAVGTDVLVSAPEVVRLAEDKWELFKWLRSQGFPTVRTFERTLFNPQSIQGPVIAKPRGGSSSIGIVRESRAADLRLEQLSDDYIIQERATGVEVTVDFAVSREGVFLGAVPRRRLEVRAGEVSKAVTLRAPALEELVRELARSLEGAYGVLNLQVFVEPSTQDIKVIELNARVGGGYPLSDKAGAGFFNQLALNSNEPLDNWKANLVMLRYDEAAFFESHELGVL